MKKIILVLSLVSVILADGTAAKKPYETTWLEITKTNSGYVVYNYPSLLNDGKTKSPYIIKVRGDSLTWITFSDEAISYKFNNKIEYLNNSSYIFKVGNVYRFDYVDKTNKIARWTIYDGYGEPQDVNMYIDSLYNKFPMVDYKWEDGPIDGEAD